MINVDLQQLIQALDAESRRDLESSAERCIARGGSKILVEDFLLALLERPQGLLGRALQEAEVDAGELAATLQLRVESSASNNPVFAPELVQWLQDALLMATIELGQTAIGQAALILSLLRNPLRYAGSRYQLLLTRLNIERFKEFALSQAAPSVTGKSAVPGESLLERFTHNLTRQARDGQLDPVLCRDVAIRQMVDILARRRKNNPIVVGEAGVGKTALVEGLALRIVAGEVPPVLIGVELLSLDMGLLQAGASVKGEFVGRRRWHGRASSWRRRQPADRRQPGGVAAAKKLRRATQRRKPVPALAQPSLGPGVDCHGRPSGQHHRQHRCRAADGGQSRGLRLGW